MRGKPTIAPPRTGGPQTLQTDIQGPALWLVRPNNPVRNKVTSRAPELEAQHDSHDPSQVVDYRRDRLNCGGRARGCEHKQMAGVDSFRILRRCRRGDSGRAFPERCVVLWAGGDPERK